MGKGEIMQQNYPASSSKPEPLLTPGTQINKRFTIKELISIGGFGEVYSANNDANNQAVAIKAESVDAKFALLRIEANCLELLNRAIKQTHGTLPREPILAYYGYGETHGVRYMVMELCGKNIRELKKSMKQDRFSITTSLWIMKKMILSIRFLHKLGWIHRDVKPANFCIGRGSSGMQELYLVDFGMARHYVSRENGLKPQRVYSAFHGTVRYASLTTHRHEDMSRFDDLWSIYYITVENMVGQLPWRSVSEKTDVQKMKEETDLLRQKYGDEIGAPACVVLLYRHLSQASFYYEPRYENTIRDIEIDMAQRNFGMQDRLDWMPKTESNEKLEKEESGVHEVVSYPADIDENEDRSYYYIV